MICTRVVFVVASLFLFLSGLSSSTEIKESDLSPSADDCDNPTLTSMFKAQKRQKRSAPFRETGCKGNVSPQMNITCDQGSTINITKGACVRVTDCDAYDPSLDSQCEDSDRTTGWAAYCGSTNPCLITGTCSAGQTCSGTYTYIYADYECIPDETTRQTTLTSPTPEESTESPSPTPGLPEETTGQATLTSPTPEESTESPSPTPDFTTIHQSLPPGAKVVQQRTSLFKRIEGRLLQNHVIKVIRGLSLVECGAECNKRHNCLSFNFGNGVCKLNNGTEAGSAAEIFIEDEEFNYYEKQ